MVFVGIISSLERKSDEIRRDWGQLEDLGVRVANVEAKPKFSRRREAGHQGNGYLGFCWYEPNICKGVQSVEREFSNDF
jgi:hypothetical protein